MKIFDEEKVVTSGREGTVYEIIACVRAYREGEFWIIEKDVRAVLRNGEKDYRAKSWLVNHFNLRLQAIRFSTFEKLIRETIEVADWFYKEVAEMIWEYEEEHNDLS